MSALTTRVPVALFLSGAVLCGYMFFAGCAQERSAKEAGGAQEQGPRAVIGYEYERQDLLSRRRELCLPAEKVVQELGITPGMTVLDLGTGQGYFAFPMADALQGTGRVFATDIMPSMIDVLKIKVAQRGYANLTPVLVSPKASDPFYQNERFDIIFVSEVCSKIDDRPAFFRRLRPRLKPGGRVFIIDADVHAVFYRGNITDPAGLFRDIRKEGGKHPVFKRLGGRLKKYVRHGDLNAPVPEAYVEELLRDFNRIIDDRTLFADLDIFYLKQFTENFSPDVPEEEERSYRTPDDYFFIMHWFEYQLGDTGVFEKTDDRLTPFERQALKVYNRLLLQWLYPDRVNGQYFVSPLHVPTPRAIIRDMREAGYVLSRRHDSLPMHFFLEFSRAEDRR